MSKLDFQAVYLACWRSVYRYAYALTRNRHEAEDLARRRLSGFCTPRSPSGASAGRRRGSVRR